MLAAGFMADPGIPRATFVGYATMLAPSGGPPEFTYAQVNIGAIAGAKVGDLCLIFNTGSSGSNYSRMLSSGWATDNYTWTPGYGYRASVFWKVLDANDLGLAQTSIYALQSSGIVIVIYRGATSAVRKVISYDDDHDDTHTVPGFTRAANCVGAVCVISDRDLDALDFGVSAGWTERLNTNVYAFRWDVADALAASDYVDGASIVWTNLGTSGPWAQVAQVYELRS